MDGPADPPPKEVEDGRTSWREAATGRCWKAALGRCEAAELNCCGATVSGLGEATELGRNSGGLGEANEAAAAEALCDSVKSGIGRCVGD